MSVRILTGDALTVLRTLPAASVQCVVTSPPYFGLRAYGTNPQVWGGDPEHEHAWGGEGRVIGGSQKQGATSQRAGRANVESQISTGTSTGAFCPCGAWRGELGSEPSPGLFIEHLLMIFDEVWRVLRPDGLCFVNLGDSYSGSGKGPSNSLQRPASTMSDRQRAAAPKQWVSVPEGIPAKNLLLVPQRFAIGMQERGWIVRSEIVWAKKSAMPESVRDRPTSAWEPIWMFAKSQRYFYDFEAVRQPQTGGTHSRGKGSIHAPKITTPGLGIKNNGSFQAAMVEDAPADGFANLRNYWLLSS